MAIKTRAKATTKTEKKPVSKVSAMEARTTVSFRTKQLTKKKAEKIFSDLGISMSGALNMFLTQVVRDKGMPFLPTVQKKESAEQAKSDTHAAELGVLEDLWEDL